MSFLRYFFTHANDASPGDGVDDFGGIEARHARLVELLKQENAETAGMDDGERIARLEGQLTQAVWVVEALIELLEEKVGLSCDEIEERVELLASTAVGEIASVPDGVPVRLVDSGLQVLVPEGEKGVFKPRRRWRDARS